ncbi:MAG: alpha-L-fucosidase [Bacteroidetes bacterium]|nr:alpha-L-fucosidase [Bacteroidota bacterium]
MSSAGPSHQILKHVHGSIGSSRWLMGSLAMLFLVISACEPVGAPTPIGALPSERQLDWHKLQYYAFIHFGPNTFTDVEWGQGSEDPQVFNPTEFDARQWARVIKAAGMEGVIITAKHHDGFALWPSAFSTHTVRESAWKEGQGDVLRELADACEEFGLKLGVYLSPWDRNHPKYGTDEYNNVFKSMLTEVLTGYGDIFEVWFDGANGEGPDGRKQEYDFPGFAAVVREHQPNAVIFSDAGPDIRWVGNERGYAAETNWSTLNVSEFFPGIGGVNDQLQHGHEDGEAWLPTEVNTSIRPGWFYHADQDDKVKSLDRLIDNWYSSVGRNGNFLLNIPVDARGLIHENDEERLLELKAYLDEAFAENLAPAGNLVATHTRSFRFLESFVVDDDLDTYWASKDDALEASLGVEFNSPTAVNTILLQEYIPLGQRVTGFVVRVLQGDEWTEVASGTTIGNRRIVRWPTVEADAISVELKGKAALTIANLELYKVPER